MPVGSSRNYGRKRVIEYRPRAHDARNPGWFAAQPAFPDPGDRRGSGVGKTALLSELDHRLDQRVPHARLDIEADNRASVPQVLSALAFDLSRKCPGYGALRFRRFIVGQLVMRLELDLTDRSRAREQVIDALRRRRGVDTISEVLVDTAGGVLQPVAR